MQTLLRTTRFGDIPLDHERIFEFPDGLLGFPGAKRFLAMNVDGDPDMYWLQCVDDGSLAFLAISPWLYFPDYEPEIDESEQRSVAGIIADASRGVVEDSSVSEIVDGQDQS